jgi:hypothetical protein
MRAGEAPELWLADTGPAADAGWVAAFEPQLSPSERARLARLVRPQRRQQFLAAHALARRAVAARTGCAANDVQLTQHPEGRPQIAVPPGLRVSLAHAATHAAVLLDIAGPDDAPLGVDIEACRAERDIEAIVKAIGENPASRLDAYVRWAWHEARHKAPAAVCGWVGAWGGFVLAAAGVELPPTVWRVDLNAGEPPLPVRIEWSARSEELATP